MARTTSTPATAEVTTEELQATIAQLQADLAAATATKTPRTAQTPLAPETAAWVATNARPAQSPCLCGCGTLTKGRFAPGHDAILKSRLALTAATETEESWDAHAALITFGWR